MWLSVICLSTVFRCRSIITRLFTNSCITNTIVVVCRTKLIPSAIMASAATTTSISPVSVIWPAIIRLSAVVITTSTSNISLVSNITQNHASHTQFDSDTTLITRVSWYQNISILDLIGAKDYRGGGENVQSSSQTVTTKPTVQHPAFYRLDALPVTQPIVSEYWKSIKFHESAHPKLTCGFSNRLWPWRRDAETCQSFSRWTWVSRYLLKQRMMEVVVTTGPREL